MSAIPARWARDIAFHCTGLLTGILGFALWVAGVSSLPLALTIVGLLFTLATLYAFRWFARVERRRAALVLRATIAERYRRPAPDAGWLARLRAIARDAATWKDFLWTGLSGSLGVTLSFVALTLWGVVLGLLSLPIWWWSLPQAVQLGVFEVDSQRTAFAAAGIGLALVPVCGLLVRGITRAELALMVALLRPSREQELSERVEVLTSTRAGAVDAQAAELQRIERDLHDGAQARLVALAMNLGMAEEKLASDPAQARELLEQARGEARTALQELRDLARGIHPPILSDRGLEAAITAISARSPIAVTIEAQLPTRPPAAVEGAAYFVVAEALANAAKHSGAQRVLVRLSRRADALAVEIADDGCGGADPQGSGLVGLRRRVEALDGSLRIVSPPGEGTTLHVALPIGS